MNSGKNLEIRQFLMGSDNFGVLVHDSETGATASIDAGDEQPIRQALAETGWRLTDILVTHMMTISPPSKCCATPSERALWRPVPMPTASPISIWRSKKATISLSAR